MFFHFDYLGCQLKAGRTVAISDGLLVFGNANYKLRVVLSLHVVQQRKDIRAELRRFKRPLFASFLPHHSSLRRPVFYDRLRD